MVFSSSPLYVDPPNWNQQVSNNIVVDEAGDLHHQLPQAPHEAAAAAASAPAPNQNSSRSEPSAVLSMAERARLAKIPQVEASLKCPRCDSTNTKFCYFNNYSLTQPRHFCKTCRRYWTRGGALRSVPVGGGCRRNKRGNKSASSCKPPTPPTTAITPSASTSSAAAAAAGLFRTAPPQFLAPWHHHFPDYGFGHGIQQPIDHNMPENMGLEQWRIQQFPFLGGLVEPSLPPAAMVPGLYPFEGELGGGHGKIMSTVKMEESSTAAAAAAPAASTANLPRQFFNVGRNDGQIWPGGGDGGGGGEGHGGRWIGGEHLSGFSSSSTGNLL